jgi:hypothetical protein
MIAPGSVEGTVSLVVGVSPTRAVVEAGVVDVQAESRSDVSAIMYTDDGVVLCI